MAEGKRTADYRRLVVGLRMDAEELDKAIPVRVCFPASYRAPELYRSAITWRGKAWHWSSPLLSCKPLRARDVMIETWKTVMTVVRVTGIASRRLPTSRNQGECDGPHGIPLRVRSYSCSDLKTRIIQVHILP